MNYQELLVIKKYFIILNQIFDNKIVILNELDDLYYFKHTDNFILISETNKELNNIPNNFKNYLDNCIYFEENIKDKPLQLFNKTIIQNQSKLNINFVQALQFEFILDKIHDLEFDNK